MITAMVKVCAPPKRPLHTAPLAAGLRHLAHVPRPVQTSEYRARCSRLQLLVFKLALQLLRLGDLAYGLVEVVLVYGVPVVLDGEETAACSVRSV